MPSTALRTAEAASDGTQNPWASRLRSATKSRSAVNCSSASSKGTAMDSEHPLPVDGMPADDNPIHILPYTAYTSSGSSRVLLTNSPVSHAAASSQPGDVSVSIEAEIGDTAGAEQQGPPVDSQGSSTTELEISFPASNLPTADSDAAHRFRPLIAFLQGRYTMGLRTTGFQVIENFLSTLKIDAKALAGLLNLKAKVHWGKYIMAAKEAGVIVTVVIAKVPITVTTTTTKKKKKKKKKKKTTTTTSVKVNKIKEFSLTPAYLPPGLGAQTLPNPAPLTAQPQTPLAAAQSLAGRMVIYGPDAHFHGDVLNNFRHLFSQLPSLDPSMILNVTRKGGDYFAVELCSPDAAQCFVAAVNGQDRTPFAYLEDVQVCGPKPVKTQPAQKTSHTPSVPPPSLISIPGRSSVPEAFVPLVKHLRQLHGEGKTLVKTCNLNASLLALDPNVFVKAGTASFKKPWKSYVARATSSNIVVKHKKGRVALRPSYL